MKLLVFLVLLGLSSRTLAKPGSAKELAKSGAGKELEKPGAAKELENVHETMKDPQRNLLEGFVAFSAAKMANMDAGSGDILVEYDILDLDIGANFANTMSTFVVPTKGIYQFQFSGKGESWAIHLKVNGDVVRSTISNNNDDKTGNSNMNSIILELEVGDIVATYHADWSSGLWNESPTNGVFTSFSGLLLQETT